MRALILSLVVVSAGCSTDRCKQGTLFISYALNGAAQSADTIDVTLAIGSNPAQTKTVARNGSNQSIQVDFATYPKGLTLTLTLTANQNGMPVATSTQTVTAMTGCTAVSVALDGAGSGDLSTSGDDMGNAGDDLSGTGGGGDMTGTTGSPDMFGCGSPGEPCCNGSCPGYVCGGDSVCQAVNVWGVGGTSNANAGSAQHWAGQSWTSVTVPHPNGAGSNFTWNFLAIWGNRASNVWAVGQINDPTSGAVTPAVERFNGTQWIACGPTDACRPSATSALTAIYGLGDNDIWATTSTQAFHWNGTQWTENSSGLDSTSIIGSIWCASTNDCYASGQTKTYHWTGTTWTNIAGMFLKNPNGIWGSSTNDVWLGCADVNRQPFMYHWDGNSWTLNSIQGAAATNQSTTKVFGLSSTDVWVVGQAGLVAHWDGTQWKTVSVGTTAPVYGVWGAASNDVWVVANDSNFTQPVYFHWNGVRWTSAQGTANTSIYGLWGSPN